MADAVVYQIYPRSFADPTPTVSATSPASEPARLPRGPRASTPSGSTPFYPSPLADGGYDITDYRDVDPRFGTLADFDHLVDQAHARGIRVIVDIVPEPHVRPASMVPGRAGGGPGSPERERYIFRDGSATDGEHPPSDWRSHFGGSAWQRAARRAVVLPPVRPGTTRPELGQPRGPRSTSSTPCGSGPTAASTGSASTSPTPWPRTSPSPSAANRTSTAPAPRRHRPPVRPRRGTRHLPRLAAGLQRIRPAADGRRRDMAPHQRPDVPLRPARPSSARSSTSPCSKSPGTATQFARVIQRSLADHQRRRRRPDLGAVQPRRPPTRHPLALPAGVDLDAWLLEQRHRPEIDPDIARGGRGRPRC